MGVGRGGIILSLNGLGWVPWVNSIVLGLQKNYSKNGVLYRNSTFQIKNPNSNAGLKNITKLVRFKTGDNDRRCERRPLV